MAPSPVALRVPLHDPYAASDHEPAGGLLRDRSGERDAGQASVRQIASVSSNVVDTLCHHLLFSAVSLESDSAFASRLLLLTKTW
jgi:hypothetical protein